MKTLHEIRAEYLRPDMLGICLPDEVLPEAAQVFFGSALEEQMKFLHDLTIGTPFSNITISQSGEVQYRIADRDLAQRWCSFIDLNHDINVGILFTNIFRFLNLKIGKMKLSKQFAEGAQRTIILEKKSGVA